MAEQPSNKKCMNILGEVAYFLPSPAEGDTCWFKNYPPCRARFPRQPAAFELTRSVNDTISDVGLSTEACVAQHRAILKVLLWLMQSFVVSELNWVCRFIVRSNSDITINSAARIFLIFMNPNLQNGSHVDRGTLSHWLGAAGFVCPAEI